MTFFYDLNKKLDEIRATPSKTHGQLNERDMSRAAKGYEKYGKEGMEALAKAGREGKDLDPVRAKYDKYDNTEVDEGLGNIVKKVGGAAKKLGSKALDTLGHGSDADMMRDLQKRMGVPQTGMKPGREPNPKVVKEKMSPAKAKSFAALAEPKDKITFADKIAGAKKEVDEMLGDVAAEAMKSALGGGRGRNSEMDEGWDDMMADVKRRAGDHSGMRVGDRVKTSKGEIEKTATGIRHTRAYDAKTGETNTGDETPAAGEKRSRGRPKGTSNRTGAKGPSGRSKLMTKESGGMKQTFAILDDTLIDQIAAMNGAEVDPDAGSVETYDENTARQLLAFAQKNPQRLKQTQMINRAGMRPMAQRVGGTASGPEYNLKEEGDDVKAAMKLLKKAGYKISKDGEQELDEKAVSKKQQKFMGMVHATQKGEKAPSKEVAKVAKTMKKKDAEDFASTKHKGLPEKKKSEGKKKEKEVDESSTTAGSVAPAAGGKGSMSFGKGIYDSMNRELESMIAESMSINMSSSTEGGSSLTVTATEEDAAKLAEILKMAGIGGGQDHGHDHGEEACPTCNQAPCGCSDMVDENSPDYPTKTEQADNNFEYSGGLNGPKSTGQSTVPVLASQEERQQSYAAEEEDAIKRMMEMAGVKKKEVDEEKTEEGNKFTGNLAKARADGKKEADLDGDGDMEKVRESVAGLWKEYKGKHGV